VCSVSLDHEGEVPPFEQLAAILREQIASGELAPGQKMPSITTLAQRYDIATSTARKALALLRKDGLIRTRRGWGTFVTKD